MMRALWTLLIVAVLGQAQAAERSYGLRPIEIAADSYVFVGEREDFSPANGGNIVNTGFIVTSAGVVVIDTGPSRRYGLEMRSAIAKVTPLPIIHVFNTHLHPDHVFGNQAFPEVEVEALAATTDRLRALGAGYADNMYRLVGPWMQGTELRLPAMEPARATLRIGGHVLETIVLAGHSQADLAILDHTAGVLWASDLVFRDRAPTTADADIPVWLASLDALETLPFTVIVPGHGPPSRDREGISQTRDWLSWLDGALKLAASDGKTMTEAMAMAIPDRFAPLALARQELVRSVVHLYPALELASLRRAE